MSSDQMDDPDALAAAVPRVPAGSSPHRPRRTWSDPNAGPDEPDPRRKLNTRVLQDRRVGAAVLDVRCGRHRIARVGRYRAGHRIDTLTERGHVRSVWLDGRDVPAACPCGTLHVLDAGALRARLGDHPGRPEQVRAGRVERVP